MEIRIDDVSRQALIPPDDKNEFDLAFEQAEVQTDHSDGAHGSKNTCGISCNSCSCSCMC